MPLKYIFLFSSWRGTFFTFKHFENLMIHHKYYPILNEGGKMLNKHDLKIIMIFLNKQINVKYYKIKKNDWLSQLGSPPLKKKRGNKILL